MELADHNGPAWRGWRFAPYAFYDLCAVWQRDRGEEDARASAASVGIGVRAHVAAVSLTAELAKPLTRPVAAEGSEGDETRVFGSLNYRF